MFDVHSFSFLVSDHKSRWFYLGSKNGSNVASFGRGIDSRCLSFNLNQQNKAINKK